MHKKLFFTCLLFLLIRSGPALAQVNASIPDYFNQFVYNHYLINPANKDSSYHYKVLFGNKSYTGLFKGVSRTYFDSDLRIRNNKNKQFHFAGIQVINITEGSFINQVRVSGRYSWRQQLSAHSSLSAGVSLGIHSYNFKASFASPGGSATVPDGSLGIWYLRQKTELGLSAQQIFNRTVKPVNQRFEISRVYNFMARRNFTINPYTQLNTSLLTSLEKRDVLFALTGIIEFQKKFDAGITYKHQSSLIFMAGVKEIDIQVTSFSLLFFYQIPTERISSSQNVLEFMICLGK